MKITVCSQHYEFSNGASALDIAATLNKELRRTTMVARSNGRLVSMPEPISEDGVLEFLDGAQPDGLRTLRHTASHVPAHAVKNLRPDVRLAIGPAIDNGFYYDFDSPEPFTPEFLAQVEKEMQRIINRNSRLERFELPHREALAPMQSEPYKIELINALPTDAKILFYCQEDFTDLCAGPRVPSTGMIKAFRLTSVAGAYWRGDEMKRTKCFSAFTALRLCPNMSLPNTSAALRRRKSATVAGLADSSICSMYSTRVPASRSSFRKA